MNGMCLYLDRSAVIPDDTLFKAIMNGYNVDISATVKRERRMQSDAINLDQGQVLTL